MRLAGALLGERERSEMQRKPAGLVLAVLILAACALPIEPQPTVAPLAPTIAPPAARLPASPTESAATPLRSSNEPTTSPAPTAPLPAPTAPGLGADELSR